MARLIDEHIPGLGKKRSQGNGWINEVIIEELDYNPFVIEVIRPIPITEKSIAYNERFNVNFSSNREAKMAYKPPYWLPEHQVFCFLPQTFNVHL